MHGLRRHATAILWLAGALSLAVPVNAAEDHGHFFFFIAPAAASRETRAALTGTEAPAGATWIHVGGGGEASLANRWGLGTDIGGVARTHGAGRIANVSVNGYFHPFARPGRHLDPYVTLGNSWFVRSDPRQTFDVPNAGAGLNYWIGGRPQSWLGVKVEFRDYVRTGPESLRYRELRVGVCVFQ